MNINPVGNVPKPHSQGTTDSNNDSKIAKVTAAPEVDANNVDSKLIERLSVSKSESRESLLNEAKAKVQSGELLTRQQAEKTSDAILNQ